MAGTAVTTTGRSNGNSQPASQTAQAGNTNDDPGTFEKINSLVQFGGSLVGVQDSILGITGAADEHKDRSRISAGTASLLSSGMGGIGALRDMNGSRKELKEIEGKLSRGEITQEEAKEQKGNAWLDMGKGIADSISGLAGMTSGAAGITEGAFGLQGKKDKADTASTVGGIADIVGGVAGTASSSIGIHRSRTEKNKKLEEAYAEIDRDTSLSESEKSERKKAKKEEISKEYSGKIFSDSMGIAGGLLGLGSGIAGLFGGKTAELFSGILGGLGGLAGMLGSGKDIIGNFFGGKSGGAGQQAATPATSTTSTTPATSTTSTTPATSTTSTTPVAPTQTNPSTP